MTYRVGQGCLGEASSADKADGQRHADKHGEGHRRADGAAFLA